MKKHIFLLLILFFAAYNTCAGQTSRYKLVTTSSLVPPEGGKLEYSLAYTAAGDSGKIKLVTSEVKLLDYEISSPLVTSVTNMSGTFFIEVAMIHPDYSASGQVRLHINVVDDNEVLWITLSYLQEPYSEFFGGRITLNGPEIYPLGTLPPIISSYRPAMGGLYLVDNPELTYTWEKKTATAQEWTTMPGQNGETCQPDVTGKETVYYRRKATRSGGQTAYSNTVEVLTALDAGLISMSLSEDNRYVIINDKKSPSVAWEHTRIEESTDLENWETISTGEKTAKKIARPAYYRRVAETSTGGKATSNIVACKTGSKAYISTKTATDSTGVGYIEDITYYDGLGRPQQTVNVNGSPSGKDLVTFFSYDTKGRRQDEYLPFAAAPEDNIPAGTDVLINRQDRYYKTLYNSSTALFPRIHREYDDSPLDRQVKTFRPGKEYQSLMDHFCENRYGTNAGDEVLQLSLTPGGALVGKAEPYDANTLCKTTAIDEDGAIEEVFTNSNGLKILSRQWLSSSEHADTYYIYDDMERLRWVVSPEGSARLTAGSIWEPDSGNARKYCYRYLYDGDGNVTTRHIPGQDPEIMTYDADGRMLTRQTGAMKAQEVLLAYTYDPIGRLSKVTLRQTTQVGPVDPTDPIRPPVDPVDPPDPVTPDPVPIDPVLPVDPEDPLLPVNPEEPYRPVTYDPAVTNLAFGVTEPHDTERYIYDEYRLDSPAFGTHAFLPVAEVTDETIRSTNVRGLKTHEEIFETFDKSVFSPARKAPLSARRTFYYDARNRVIQSVETTPLGYGLRISYKYDYSGNILIRDEQHNISEGEPLNLRYAYTYDGRGRQLREVVSINGKVCADVASAYDELGRLQTKTAGNGLETEHKYNIQGWLSGITHRIKAPSVNLQTGDTLWIHNIIFTEQLNYFKPQAAKPLYSGNIAEISWNRGGDVMGDNTYAYSYDMLGRLTDAELYKREPSENFPGFSPLRDNTFTERRMEYDLNGNMRSFERYNGDEILKYKYLLDGNQLVRVKRYPGTKDSERKVAFGIEEADNPFEYDAMGNLVYDGQNQLKISYDFLNLPEKIAPAELHSQAGKLFLANYCYLWNGEKVASTDVRGNGYLYIGSVRYSLDSAKPAFESAPFAMGRIGRLGGEYGTRYFLNDHLGSVRAIVNQNGVVTAEYDYMPYGMQHKNSSLATSDTNEFRYNGKELQSRFCVDLYDSQARLQGMNARFNSIDPLAEKYFPVSPYAYCGNNPIRFTDPNGKDWRDKIAGVVIGLVTNITGTTSWRADYEPNDADDYNNALAATDVTTTIIGTAMSEGGKNAAITGAGISATAATATLLTAGSAIEVTGPTMAVGEGIALTGTVTSFGGKILMLNAAKNARRGYNYGGPEANDGTSKPHGNADHNNTIDKKVQEIKGQGKARNIRKNQQQVDAQGKKVGRNRPDLQWDKDGIHHNYEVDRNVKNNVKHERVIRQNDPNAIYEKEIIK